MWAAISLIGILLFTSGHMFNQIRRVPYIAGDGRGGASYFAPGFQNQYGLETQVIAALCMFPHLVLLPHPTPFPYLQPNLVLTFPDGLLSFAVISLAVKAPRMIDPKLQQVSILAWGGVLFVMYSFLLSIFRIKNSGYPFALPPFM